MRDLDTAQCAVQALRGFRTGRPGIIAMPSPGTGPLLSIVAAYTPVANSTMRKAPHL
jgi:hypothetical protein